MAKSTKALLTGRIQKCKTNPSIAHIGLATHGRSIQNAYFFSHTTCHTGRTAPGDRLRGRRRSRRCLADFAAPVISDVEGFKAYYVVYAPDDTATSISLFNDYAGAEESNRRAIKWIEES